MRPTVLALRRSGAQSGLLVTVLLLAATIVATVGATVGYVQSAATTGAREALGSAATTARAVQVQTRLADDVQAQDARVREVVEAELPGVPLDVHRTVRTEPLPLEVPGSPDAAAAADRAVLEVDPSVAEVAEADGAWPTAGGETALQASAAQALGVAVGDVVVVDRSASDPEDAPGTELTVVGTWHPTAPDDPRWFDDPLTTAGSDGGVAGPFLVTDATLAGLDTDPLVRWTVVPDAARVDAADLDAAAGAASVRDRLRQDDLVAVRGITVAGDLATTATEARTALRAAAAVTLVPVALLVVVSVVALVQVARLLAQTRASEVALLVARGARTGQLGAWAAAEGAVVVGAGALLGAGGAQVLLAATASGVREVAVPWLVAGAAGVVGTLLVTAVAWHQARTVARRQVSDRSGRARTAAAVGTLVLTGALAGLCLWQLLRYGSPVVTTGGTAQVDLLAVLAPAAVLVVLALVTTAVLGPVSALAERLAARGPRLTSVLAARQVARSLVVVAVPVVLVVLAAGSGTLAGVYGGTTVALRDAVAELRTGADVRVVVGGPVGVTGTADPPVVARYADLDGASGATTVLDRPAVLGEDPVALLALDAGAAQDVLTAPAGTVDELADGLAGGTAEAGTTLPDDATGLALDVTASAALTVEVTPDMPWYWYDVHQPRTLRTVAWVADEAGALSRVPLTALDLSYAPDGDAQVGASPSSHRVEGELPGPGHWRLVGVDVEAGTPAMPARVEVTVDAVAATSASGEEQVGLGDGWGPVGGLVREELAVVEAVGGAGFAADLTANGLPLTFRVLPAPEAGEPVPVSLPAPLAERYDLAPGDETELTLAGVDVPMQVAAVVDALPGAVDRAAVLADQGTLLQHLLRTLQAVPRPDEVWLGAQDPAGRDALATAAAGLARDEGAQDVEVTVAGADAGPDVSAPVRVAFWLAAAGAVVLALAGVLAVASALLRSRRAEVMVLRALGTPASAQARGRALELLAVTVASLLLGVLAGAGVAVLTVPALARATLGEAAQVLPVPLAAAVVPTALVVVALLVGLVAVSGVVAARVRAQALDGEYREETR